MICWSTQNQASGNLYDARINNTIIYQSIVALQLSIIELAGADNAIVQPAPLKLTIEIKKITKNNSIRTVVTGIVQHSLLSLVLLNIHFWNTSIQLQYAVQEAQLFSRFWPITGFFMGFIGACA